MKNVQCYELFGGIALKNHAFSFSITETSIMQNVYRENETNLPSHESLQMTEIRAYFTYCRLKFQIKFEAK